MKLSYAHVAILVLIGGCLRVAQAIPAWDMFASREEIGELVPGATIVHAFTHASSNDGGPVYLRSSEEPGIEANATIGDWKHPLGPPSQFFVSKGSLYQITNHTHILYADLVNATTELAARDKTSDPVVRPAFKLRLSKKKTGLTSGTWEWFTSMLQFRLGKRSNYGLFYKCVEDTGETNIYVPLNPGRTPDGCDILTLQSFSVQTEEKL